MELYKERKIIQKASAENLINSIATNNAKKRAKGLKEYEKKIERFETAKPAGERLAVGAEKARDARKVRCKKKNY